jgi:hypothetical protein
LTSTLILMPGLMGFWERLLFGGSRVWVTRRARGQVLEIGVGTGSLRLGDVQALDIADESTDSVVSSFTFCTVPDPLVAAREAHHGGRLGLLFLVEAVKGGPC